MLKNDILLRSLFREHVEYTPIWLMRQAGRYLPEYRKVRELAGSFMSLLTNPDYACEVTLQPLRRYNLDAVILFSDILTIPNAMGLGLSFTDGLGPSFTCKIRTEDDIKRFLSVPDMNSLGYVFDTIKLVNNELKQKVPLIGFSGSPWTLACYMVEGQSSKDFANIKKMLYSRPDLLHKILEINTESIIQYLNFQIDAGVDALMLFDTWGGILTGTAFKDFSLAYNKKIFDSLNRIVGDRRIPVVSFTKGGSLWLKDIVKSGCDAIGLDWTIDMAEARRITSDSVALQGNLDPLALLGNHSLLRSEARNIIESFGFVGNSGHVFNIGHGLTPSTDPDAVAELIEEVHSYSRLFHV
ncbi:uroporphyrinogen III decarboxylase hemE [Candidatus Kinetoplastibacterium blastocrithidii TCC012E]|uniref:Uroporphyrinogen decarboxylase n=2 Tax=Candidatus Kinetoplastidibacterium blastocrithidiae TaxID=233181 RepID=M1LAI4_9PROT|nr:uroporphyrinogen decarboxylase [Candidatus Kinetoplastibacterium blastocrithidii]AEM25263.1 uroporphyrinogen III decarboxilase [Candidatus Kinetoplastibacterium blastocrithidii]AGF49508.1 uroporphyrinogen III decarboxylase hemE [Candidatus Kinetoplastibacterium blastocrithidii TCC012E]